MWFSKERTYLDHASATPVLPEAVSAVAAAMDLFGNPGAIHQEAVAAKVSLQNSRERIALLLGCKARDIIFTSGLTEANNLAVLGLARKLAMEGKDLTHTHWITSSIEHASVLETFSEIERLGGTVSHIDPNEKGMIEAETVKHALKKETVCVSIFWGNNEIGTLSPLREIAAVIRAFEKEHGTKILFHSDAGQAPLYEHPQVHTLGIDSLSLGSGKMYGPRGIGALYLSSTASIAPLQIGGGQERGLRSGTEDPALAAGFATAFEIISGERDEEARRLKKIRDAFAKQVLQQIQGTVINGDIRHTLPHMLNISIPDINSEYLVLALDRDGIALSTKSACNEGESASHVVAALCENTPTDEWRAKNTLRFSLGRGTRERDTENAVGSLAANVGKSR